MLETGTFTHSVKQGETLSTIAHRFGVDWRQLSQINHVADPSRLRIGMKLHIPRHTRHVNQTAPHVPSPLIGQSAPSQTGAGRLGDLSMRFETGFRPGQEAQAAAVVSSGVSDPGGVSYGAYQLASSASGGRQVQTFLTREGLPWASAFSDMNPTTRDGLFGATWKKVAGDKPMDFFWAQHSYIERSHYSPVVSHVKSVSGVDISRRSRPVQNSVWSMSVQHGRAPRLVERAVEQVGAQASRSDDEYDRDLINMLYDIRNDYVDALGLTNLKSRYTVERAEALQQIGAK